MNTFHNIFPNLHMETLAKTFHRFVITNGTGTAARMSNMPVAGKTGTTTDSVDLWLSAYTPYLTASVWTGLMITNRWKVLAKVSI